MKMIMWGILGISAVLLMLVIFRSRVAGRWLTFIGMNVVIAAFLLYFLNLMSSYTHFTIPMNLTTLGTVGVLGIPGLLLLVALKAVLL